MAETKRKYGVVICDNDAGYLNLISIYLTRAGAIPFKEVW